MQSRPLNLGNILSEIMGQGGDGRTVSGSFPLDRRLARLVAIQLLYQLEINHISPAVAVEEFRLGYMSEEIDGIRYAAVRLGMLSAIVEGVFATRAKLDRQIDEVLGPKISAQRMELLLRVILRTGVYELLAHRDLSLRVIVSEYLEIAQAFYDQNEPALINAVLDRIAHSLRDQPEVPSVGKDRTR